MKKWLLAWVLVLLFSCAPDDPLQRENKKLLEEYHTHQLGLYHRPEFNQDGTATLVQEVGVIAINAVGIHFLTPDEGTKRLGRTMQFSYSEIEEIEYHHDAGNIMISTNGVRQFLSIGLLPSIEKTEEIVAVLREYVTVEDVGK